MTAATVSLSVGNGIPRFYCPFCAATVFDPDDGVAETLCNHVKVFVDWVGEPYFPLGATDDLVAKLEELDPGDPLELSAVFGEDTVVFELVEPGRGGGHDTSSCLVVLGIDGNEVDPARAAKG
jgi:hypothetical protein